MSEIDDRLDRLESQLDCLSNTLTDSTSDLTFIDRNPNSTLAVAPAATDVSAESNAVELPDIIAGHPDNNTGTKSPKRAATPEWSS
jgi:hypothetical protein